MNAVIVMVCDQPFITATLIAKLIARHAAHRTLNIACAYADTIGVPALFTRHFFRRLAALPDERGARQFLQEWPHSTATIPFPEGAIDIDTSEDCLMHLRSAKNRTRFISGRRSAKPGGRKVTKKI